MSCGKSWVGRLSSLCLFCGRSLQQPALARQTRSVVCMLVSWRFELRGRSWTTYIHP